VIENETPIGANLSAALYEPSILGNSFALIRRSSFESVGGYRELRDVNHEDWELQLQLLFAGSRMDVLPEFLHLYRKTGVGLTAGVPDIYRAQRRIVDTYNQQLGAIGIHDGGDVLFGLYERCKASEQRLADYPVQMPLGARTFESIADSELEQQQNFYRELDVKFGTDDNGPPILRHLRRLYRRHLPLQKRLELHDKLMGLIGKRSFR
jgi:hypothetical protein